MTNRQLGRIGGASRQREELEMSLGVEEMLGEEEEEKKSLRYRMKERT